MEANLNCKVNTRVGFFFLSKYFQQEGNYCRKQINLSSSILENITWSYFSGTKLLSLTGQSHSYSTQRANQSFLLICKVKNEGENARGPLEMCY